MKDWEDHSEGRWTNGWRRARLLTLSSRRFARIGAHRKAKRCAMLAGRLATRSIDQGYRAASLQALQA